MKVWTVSYVNTDTKRSEVSGVFKTLDEALEQIRAISGLDLAKFEIVEDDVHSAEILTDPEDDENSFTVTRLEVS